MDFLVERVDLEAKLPVREHSNDAGIDFFTISDEVINPGERKVLRTGLRVAIPKNHVLLLKDKSGLSVKNGVHILAGVIDSDYRGEIKVCLFNSTIPLPLWETPQSDDVRVDIKKGDRIAQIIFHSLPKFIMMEVYSLNDTERSMSGFGSSGT